MVADGASRFGLGESSLTVGLPLSVRPSAPRFLHLGDTFELPVLVQNQTADAVVVDVAASAAGIAFASPGGASHDGRRVTVPGYDRVEVRLPATAVAVGAGRIQVSVAGGSWSDAARIELPIWTPATTETFATHGVVDEGAVAEPFALPAESFAEFGGLNVSTASTNLYTLVDSLRYLVDPGYEGIDRLASRVLAISAVQDLLAVFQVAGIAAPERLAATVDSAVRELEHAQGQGGGFGLWPDSRGDWPFVAVHAAHALARAHEKGFRVSPTALELAKRYLEEIGTKIPTDYPAEVRQTIEAYALAVRDRLGDRDARRATALLLEMGGAARANLESLGWLLPVLTGDPTATAAVGEILGRIGNEVVETAGNAQVIAPRSETDYLTFRSPIRTQAIVLEALIGADRGSDLIPKLATGLLSARKAGRWPDTQANVFALLALDAYFRAFESTPPELTARVWLGQGLVGDHHFLGRQLEPAEVAIPMSALPSGPQEIVIGKEGAGRLYYRVGVSYAPKDPTLAAFDAGFHVERLYAAVDTPTDVRRAEHGTWHVRAGARVRVCLNVAADVPRYHVALVDPLPAGLEPLGPEIEIGRPAAYRAAWYDHENLRDERAEVFAALLPAGAYAYCHTTLATTPGRFVAPPTKVEEQYSPETFGRTHTDYLIVE